MILGLRQAKASYHNVNKRATLLEILSNQSHMVKGKAGVCLCNIQAPSSSVNKV